MLVFSYLISLPLPQRIGQVIRRFVVGHHLLSYVILAAVFGPPGHSKCLNIALATLGG